MKKRFLEGVMRLLGCLSLGVAQKLGTLAGALLWWFRSDSRRVTELNLALCYPEKSAADRRALARRSLLETGKLVFEIPLMWEWPLSRCLGQVTAVRGLEHLEAAQAEGRGLILLAPHLGNWELAGLYFSARFDMAALYRPPKRPEFEAYMKAVRGRAGSELVPTDRRGVARLFTILRDGGVVGILPDQDPTGSGGGFAPFFGVPANTIKLVGRLIEKTGARALVTYARRLPRAGGFELVVQPADPRLYDSDLTQSLTGLNASVEHCVRDLPEQYQWEYKRFKRRPKGEPLVYNPGRISRG